MIIRPYASNYSPTIPNRTETLHQSFRRVTCSESATGVVGHQPAGRAMGGPCANDYPLKLPELVTQTVEDRLELVQLGGDTQIHFVFRAPDHWAWLGDGGEPLGQVGT